MDSIDWIQQLEAAAEVPSSGKGEWKAEFEYNDGQALGTFAIFWHPGGEEMSVPIAQDMDEATAQAICLRRNTAALVLEALRELALLKILNVSMRNSILKDLEQRKKAIA